MGIIPGSGSSGGTASKYATGTYTGSGTINSLNLGLAFTPVFIIILSKASAASHGGFVVSTGQNIGENQGTWATDADAITATGMTLTATSNKNVSSIVYQWIAFG